MAEADFTGMVSAYRWELGSGVHERDVLLVVCTSTRDGLFKVQSKAGGRKRNYKDSACFALVHMDIC